MCIGSDQKRKNFVGGSAIHDLSLSTKKQIFFLETPNVMPLDFLSLMLCPEVNL